MSYEDLLTEMAKQNDHLRQQLLALAKLGTTKRRQYQLVELRCGRCGDVLLEVMRTDPYATFRYRRTVDHPSVETLPVDADLEARLSQMREKVEQIRRGPWTFYPIDDPIPEHGDPRRLLSCSCSCARHKFSEAFVFDLIRQGTRRKVIHPPPR